MTVTRFNRLFPLWALILSVVAYFNPDPFAGWRPAVFVLLGFIMFCMGLGLSGRDFLRALEYKSLVTIAILLQYSVMPAAGILLAHLFGLPSALVAGVVLVGAAPGGTASNVICYLAGGDVALSVTITAISTLMCLILTPAISYLLLGAAIEIPWRPMLFSILFIVILPLAGGILLHRLAPQWVQRMITFTPSLSIIAICLIIAIIVAINHQRLLASGWLLVSVVLLHNLAGLCSGYLIPRMLGFNKKYCKTISIEVGMQNSGLATAIALQYFSALSALPGALFSFIHNISGSLLASYWQRRDNTAAIDKNIEEK